MQNSYVDELFEMYIAALINAKMWQTIAAEKWTGGIPGPTLENARSIHRQTLEPLWNEYVEERQLGNAPEQALQKMLARIRNL